MSLGVSDHNERSKGRLRLPRELIDAHHHFVDTHHNDFNKLFLRSKLPGVSYLPQDYQNDVVQPLLANGIHLVGSVHMEALPDDGLAEVEWIESFMTKPCCTVVAIVASCDLAAADAVEKLQKLVHHNRRTTNSTSKVKGVRWILDCVTTTLFEPDTATHVGVTRHPPGQLDYLRSGDSGAPLPELEQGFAALEALGLSFDLQCAPAQLSSAARLCAKYPNIPVCINHLGKPRPRGVDVDGSKFCPSDKEINEWRSGMKAMAQLPNTYVKISMLGYIVPGWIQSQVKIDFVRELVRETVALFGAHRCMVGLNWWKDAATSDSDGRSAVGPDSFQLVSTLAKFFEDYSDDDQYRLFVGTAREFYRI